MNILIIGASGGLANILTGLLHQSHPHAHITGVDSRPLKNDIHNPNFKFRKMRYTRSQFEKLFREKRFDYVYHLGRMSHVGGSNQQDIIKRLNLNLIGTNKILELSLQFDVKKIIVLSTHHVYGALSDNPVYLKEDAPLRASIKYPELRDVTEMDSLCTNWMWRFKDKISTVIFRPCNIIGPQINNSISQYLRSDYSPLPIDFNPMFQFIHELDMATILKRAIDDIDTGVYNVAPEQTVSLAKAKELVGSSHIDFPISLVSPLAFVLKKFWSFPDYLLDYIKHSCIIDGNALRRQIPDHHYRYTIDESLKLINL
ncbi:MAG: NAD-dependent epimerase/dehydratase family protein [Bdellovibrionota bacterium]|nr:NAD-dependent epimerase/dehydratase family protein [Bdellovibrionota bacterium]